MNLGEESKLQRADAKDNVTPAFAFAVSRLLERNC